MWLKILSLSMVLLVLQVFLSDSQRVNDELWEKAERKCQALSKINTNEKALLLTSLGAISRTAKCYVNCFFEEVGLMIDAAVNNTLLQTWIEEEANASENKDSLYEKVKDCVENIKVEEKCDKAYELYLCFENR